MSDRWESQVAHIVNVSGGKDSTALYLLAIERGRPFRAVFADTGNEHSATYEFVRTLPERTGGPPIQWVRPDFSARFERRRMFIAERWPDDGVPAERVARALDLMRSTGIPFLDLCLLKGRFPSTRARFCTEELKTLPIHRQVLSPLLSAGGCVVSWQGVRAEESRARALLPRRQRLQSEAGRLYAWRPLIDWTIGDVWEMHGRHGISPNPLYAAGFRRVGCMPCIMARKDEIRRMAALYPAEVARVEEWERIVAEASKRGATTFFAPDKTPGPHKHDTSLPMPGIRDVVKWSRTSRGGRQADLLALADMATDCSGWGACE